MPCTCWILLANSLISFVRASHKMIHWLFSYSGCRFAIFRCDFSLAFCCCCCCNCSFWAGSVEPTCLLARLFGLLLLLSLFSKGAAFGYSWCAADANESTGLLLHASMCEYLCCGWLWILHHNLAARNFVRCSDYLVPKPRTILRVKTWFSPLFLPLYFYPNQALL